MAVGRRYRTGGRWINGALDRCDWRRWDRDAPLLKLRAIAETRPRRPRRRLECRAISLRPTEGARLL